VTASGALGCSRAAHSGRCACASLRRLTCSSRSHRVKHSWRSEAVFALRLKNGSVCSVACGDCGREVRLLRATASTRLGATSRATASTRLGATSGPRRRSARPATSRWTQHRAPVSEHPSRRSSERQARSALLLTKHQARGAHSNRCKGIEMVGASGNTRASASARLGPHVAKTRRKSREHCPAHQPAPGWEQRNGDLRRNIEHKARSVAIEKREQEAQSDSAEAHMAVPTTLLLVSATRSTRPRAIFDEHQARRKEVCCIDVHAPQAANGAHKAAGTESSRLRGTSARRAAGARGQPRGA
jgi:hypothetical protein